MVTSYHLILVRNSGGRKACSAATLPRTPAPELTSTMLPLPAACQHLLPFWLRRRCGKQIMLRSVLASAQIASRSLIRSCVIGFCVIAIMLLSFSVCSNRVRADKNGPPTKPESRAQPFQDDKVYALCYSPDGSLLAGTSGNVIIVWRVRDGEVVHVLRGHQLGVGSIAFSKDGRLLASTGSGGKIRLWDLASGKVKRLLYAGQTSVGGTQSVRFYPKGKYLAASYWDVNRGDRIINLWDFSAGKSVKQLAADASALCDFAFSPDGRYLAAAVDEDIQLWSMPNGKRLRCLIGHKRGLLVSCLAFTPNSMTIVSGGEDHTIRIWDVRSGKETGQLLGHENAVDCLAISSDGALVGSAEWLGNQGHRIRLWRLATRQILWSVKVKGEYVDDYLVFAPDNSVLTIGGARQVQFLDLKTGKSLEKKKGAFCVP
jgi:WD40 repeat protein